jgi:hypothetical protein
MQNPANGVELPFTVSPRAPTPPFVEPGFWMQRHSSSLVQG